MKERIDRIVSKLFPEFSRNFLKKQILAGKLKINGNTIMDPDFKFSGSTTEIEFELKQNIIEQEDISNPKLDLDIVYQDSDILVINKPIGLVCHPGVGNKSGTILQDVMDYCNPEDDLHLVHRLDKDTSGLLLVPLNPKSHKKLISQFLDRSIKRTYWGLCWGHFEPKQGRIIANIGRSRTNFTKKQIGGKNSKEGITLFKVIKSLEFCDLVEFNLLTGRTHQIRVHCEYMKHPLVGDRIYTNNIGCHRDRAKNIGLNRQWLHAKKLEFIHPTKQEKMLFEVPIPKDLEDTLKDMS